MIYARSCSCCIIVKIPVRLPAQHPASDAIILIRAVGIMGTLKTRDWKMQDWKTRDQIAWVEIAGLENGGPVLQGWKTRDWKTREHNLYGQPDVT